MLLNIDVLHVGNTCHMLLADYPACCKTNTLPAVMQTLQQMELELKMTQQRLDVARVATQQARREKRARVKAKNQLEDIADANAAKLAEAGTALDSMNSMLIDAQQVRTVELLLIACLL
jgi:hypothetical protein